MVSGGGLLRGDPLAERAPSPGTQASAGHGPVKVPAEKCKALLWPGGVGRGDTTKTQWSGRGAGGAGHGGHGGAGGGGPGGGAAGGGAEVTGQGGGGGARGGGGGRRGGATIRQRVLLREEP